MILKVPDDEASQRLLLQDRCCGGCVTMTLSSEAPLGNGAVGEFFGDTNICTNSWDAVKCRHMGQLGWAEAVFTVPPAGPG